MRPERIAIDTTEVNPQFRFGTPGKKKITLIATDIYGKSYTVEKTITIAAIRLGQPIARLQYQIRKNLPVLGVDNNIQIDIEDGGYVAYQLLSVNGQVLSKGVLHGGINEVSTSVISKGIFLMRPI